VGEETEGVTPPPPEGGVERSVEQLVTRPYGGVQTVKTGRKLFGKERRQTFLEHLAATCNVKGAARAAGVTIQCVYQRRMQYADFRAEWAQALEHGYARLEARALEEAMGAGRSEVRGDLVLDEEGPLDKELTIFLLREHRKGLAGLERPGAAPRAAEWAEVEAWCLKRLKALERRLGGGGKGEGEGEAA
jgi:hypothetical protein